MKSASIAVFAFALTGGALSLQAYSYAGWMETANCTAVTGWAYDGTQPNSPTNVDVYDLTANGVQIGLPIGTVSANIYRTDLFAQGYGNGYHGFSMTIPPYLKDGQVHYIGGYFGGTNVSLNSTVSFYCPAGTTGYVYYYTDPLTSINAGNWTQNGTVSATSGGLTATSSSGGSLISSIAVPDGTADYEVKTKLTLTVTGGTYVTYFRASSNAKTGPGATGTFYSLELTPTFNGSVCTTPLTLNKSVSGVVTQLAVWQLYCFNGMTFRAAMKGTTIVYSIGSYWGVYSDGSITTGKPGVGAFGTPAGNSVAAVSLGPGDRIAPQAVNPATVTTSVLPTRVDLRFPGVPDDPGGTGIINYQIYKDGYLFATSSSPEFSDSSVTASSQHSYAIYVFDYHWNYTGPTTITVTTPPAGTVDPRRIGLRSTGTYWGGASEQIDVRSGNLNFALPLLRAQGRGGWGVPFGLSYNSQNWRQNSGTTWSLGSDSGYGFGWNLGAGVLIPYYVGAWAPDHYTFIDSSGAEYRLDQNSYGIWTSRESAYLWYDSTTSRLYFRDGSFWVFGCTSGGIEPDAGILYPTIMENTNGNQVLVQYVAGVGSPFVNTSGRIQVIRDVRADPSNGNKTYTFSYTTDAVPHLSSIVNWIGTSEGYLFNYASTQPLTSPFSSQTFGGMTGLASVNVTSLNLAHAFTYNASGEMTQATFPYGGYLKWTYGSVTYSTGFTQREVQTRTMSKDGTAGAEVVYPFAHESNPSTQPVHQFTSLNDPGGVGQKYWGFSQSGANIGLTTQYQGRQFPGPSVMIQNDFTWNQDANSNFYLGSTLSTFYPGPNQSKTDQTVDVYGNVTQVKKYHFDSLTTPARTYTYSYLNSSPYTSRYIFNRLTSATVSDGSTTLPLVTNVYDGSGLASVNGTPTQWDSSYASQTYRGNLTTSYTPTGTGVTAYDQTGNPTSVTANNVTTQVTNAGTNNFAAPTQLTVGTLSTGLSWTSFLGLTNETGPNGDSASTYYDAYARPASSTSPFGAATNYTYNSAPFSAASPATITATTNGRWTRTTLDGFGRTIKAETGDGSGTKSVAESVYGPCACSPLGKLVQQALPHAPGATPAWTTYTYDGLGRTLTATTAGTGTQGTTTYTYISAAATQVVDPAGHWKWYWQDALGHFTGVYDPPTGNEPLMGTSYYYDLLDHLTTVVMSRSTGTQTRTFNYNNTGFLQSATNPENGTVTYTYNSFNKVATKTDAKGQQVRYTYDGLARLTEVHRFNSSLVEDTCERETYFYDSNPFDGSYSQYSLGRLAAVQYMGGGGAFGACGTTFTEMYTYNQAGARIGKRLRVQRQAGRSGPYYDTVTLTQDLNSTYAYDNEGRMTSQQYPLAGPNLGYAYDTMGRLNTMTDLGASLTIISGSTYGSAGQLLTMTGRVNESRTYNSLLQLTQLSSSNFQGTPQVNITYGYPSTTNLGKISSQTDNLSGEQIVYAYDNMNRLATAQATNNSWGQSYGYDGFGNLTDQNVIAGSAPTMHVAVSAVTNRIVGGNYDANGNDLSQGYYDFENRLVAPSSGNWQYSYGPGNKRVWRGVWTSGTQTTDEVTFWSVTGQKLATYSITMTPYIYSPVTYQPTMTLAITAANTYFGGKLIANASGYVFPDRLGSIGKYYPYGQEKPSATANGKEKFATYFRDAETGLDYSQNRYHQPGMGRFMTPDPYMASGGPANPGSWNRYAYTEGDPVNFGDPLGLMAAAAQADGIELPPIRPPTSDIPGDILTAVAQRGGERHPEVNRTQRDILEEMFDVAATALDSYASDFAKRLRQGDIGEDCAKDVAALGISADAWADTLDNLFIQMGPGNKDPYYTALPVGSPERALAEGRGWTVGSNFGQGSRITAISSVNDNRVWIDPRKTNPGDWSGGSALIAHEALHKFGLLDDQIQSKLGITVGAASVNISQKLASDCFLGPAGILLY